MTKEELKKIAIALAAGATIGAGGVSMSSKDCDYTVAWKGEELCITQQEKDLIESELSVSQGFGGIRFGK